MRCDTAQRLSEASECFGRLVAPVLERVFKGRIRLIEGADAEKVDTDLDLYSGIDGWHVLKAKGRIRGIASRVQYTDRPWDTFTIRESVSSGAETELAKRIAALAEPDAGWILPGITSQAYISPDRAQILSLGVALTADLYRYIEANEVGRSRSAMWRKTNPCDGNTFLIVPWPALRRSGARIWTRQNGLEQCTRTSCGH